jgi:hypothetical protein
MEKYNIDYVAHDDEPYLSAGHDDVYAFVKSIGLSDSHSFAFKHPHRFVRKVHTDASHARHLNEFTSGTDSHGLPRA